MDESLEEIYKRLYSKTTSTEVEVAPIPRTLTPKKKTELQRVAELSQKPIERQYIQEPTRQKISETEVAEAPRSREIDPVTGGLLRTILSPAKASIEGIGQGAETLIESGKDIAKGDVGTGLLGLLAGGIRTGFSAATPFVPVLAGFTAGQQALQETAPESVNKAVETVMSPVSAIAQPETKAGQYGAELGDLVYQMALFGGISKGSKYFRNIEKTIPFPKADKPLTLQLDDMVSFGTEITKQKEVKNAVKERQVAESGVEQYQGAPEIRTATETGGGNRIKESGKIQEEIANAKSADDSIRIGRESQNNPEAIAELESIRNKKREESKSAREKYEQTKDEADFDIAQQKALESQLAGEAYDRAIGKMNDKGEYIPLEETQTFSENVTGFKNDIINAERSKEGKKPLETEVREGLLRDTWDEAGEKIESGTYSPKTIAENVVRKGKIPDKVEVTVLGRETINLRKQKSTIQDNIIEYRKQGEKQLEYENISRLNEIEKQLELYDSALRIAGTQASDALNVRRMLIKEDMTVANFTKEWEARFNKPVPENILKKIQELELQNRNLTNKLDEITSQKELDITTRQIRREIRREKRVRTQEELTKEWDDLNKQLFTTLSRANVGLPVDAVPLVGKMAVNLIERGITKATDIVDTIYEQLKDKVEGLSKRSIMDAISGYGKEIKPKEKSDIEKAIQDIRQQMILLSKIEDSAKGIKSPKLKLGKQEPSPELKELQKRYKEIIKQEKSNEKDVDKYDDRSDFLKRLQREKTRLRSEIAKYRNKLEQGDFIEKETTPVYDRETIKLQGELKRVREEFYNEMQNEKRRNRTGKEKALYWIDEITELSRMAFQTVADLSYPFRQGVAVIVSNPKEWSRAWGDMIRAIKSDKAYSALEDAIEFSPNGDYYKKFGLDITRIHGVRGAKEEMYRGELAYKIPVWGEVVKASGRSATAFANKLRADLMDNAIKTLENLGYDKNNPADFKYFKDYADIINILTARGNLGWFEKAAPILNKIFYSPKMIAARIQAVTKLADPNLTAPARKQLAKSMTSFVGSGMAILTLAKLMGAEVEADPRSTDFGKIRLGNTRIDIWGGFQGYARGIAQIVTGKQETTSGKIRDANRLERLLTFFRGKLSPQASYGVDALAGENIIGEEFNALSALGERITPLAGRDILEAIQEHGLAKGSLVGAPAIFGVGVTTYDKSKKKEKEK